MSVKKIQDLITEYSSDDYLEAIIKYREEIEEFVRSLKKRTGLEFFLRVGDLIVPELNTITKILKNPCSKVLDRLENTFKSETSFFLNLNAKNKYELELENTSPLICLGVHRKDKCIGMVVLVPPKEIDGADIYLILGNLLSTLISYFLDTIFLSYLLPKKLEEIVLLKRKTVYAQEEERKLIAFDIHDVISQRAAALYYRLQTMEQLIDRSNKESIKEDLGIMQEMSQVMLDDITRLIFNLKPPHLEELGIEASLRRYLEQIKREYSINAELTVKGSLEKLPYEINITAYRIIQEALTNVHKHAQVQKAVVYLEKVGDALLGEVIDRGVGFDPEQTPHQSCMGIVSMRERAHLAEGFLQITSQKKKGTTVKFSLPL